MYPVEPKPPEKELISLKDVADIEEKIKHNIVGHYIKDMTCDAYGHPIFAIADNKVGGLAVYDAVEQQMLRKLGGGYHSVDSVTIDGENNFVMTVEKEQTRSLAKYNLKGVKIGEITLADISKLYAVCSLPDNMLAVSLITGSNVQAVRTYQGGGGEMVDEIGINQSTGKSYFMKPLYITANSDRIVVGDVGLKQLLCFSIDNQSENRLLWTYKMDMPRGMCIDGGGNICACDFKNNRVTLLTPEGHLIGHAFTGLSKPQYIAMNGNMMYVIDMGKSTNYRLMGYNLFKTQRKHSKSKPEWK